MESEHEMSRRAELVDDVNRRWLAVLEHLPDNPQAASRILDLLTETLRDQLSVARPGQSPQSGETPRRRTCPDAASW